ncbi:MAG: S8 family serine peptidase, partial [Halanaerobiales bacterium]
ATVNSSGEVTAKAEGQTEMEVTVSAEGYETTTKKINVEVIQSETETKSVEFEVTPDILDMKVEETDVLMIDVIEPTNNYTVDFVVNDEDIATVNSSGEVTAKAEGQTEVEVIVSAEGYNKKSKIITVRVTGEETVNINGDLNFIYQSSNISSNNTAFKTSSSIDNSGFVEDTGEIIVRLDSSLNFDEFQNTIKSLENSGYKIIDSMFELHAVLVKKPVSLNKISSLTDFHNIVEEYTNGSIKKDLYFDHKIPNDERFSEQWGSKELKLPLVWDQITGSSRINIAVLDTGVDYNHPDLANVVDLDSSYDFSGGEGETNPDPMDISGHGTHVAGIVSAVGDNNFGVAGTMWESNIMAVKVLDDSGNGTEWTVSQGMLYSAGLLENNQPAEIADIITMSLSGPSEVPLVKDAIDKIRNESRKEVIITASAGNHGNSASVNYPANYDEVISVGALKESEPVPELSHYSNGGLNVDFLAPGSSILSTDINGEYSYKTGTSMATPYVAGIMGLMLSEGIPPKDIQPIIERTSYKADNGVRIINTYKAINEVDSINIIVGHINNDTIENIVYQEEIPLNSDSFSIENIPSGEYEVIAWVDTKNNGVIENGDYIATTNTTELKEGNEYSFSLDLEEYDSN